VGIEKNKGRFGNTVTARGGVREAVDIERLLHWVYAMQKPHYGGRMGGGGGGYDGLAALGTRVDGTGAGVWRCDEDAETLHAMVDRLPDPLLIRRHAEVGGHPDWKPGAWHRVVPMWRTPPADAAPGQKPRPVMEYNERKHPVVCLLREVDPPEYTAMARATYGQWHGALTTLVQRCAKTPLRRFDAVGPVAPAAPWLSPRKRVLRDLSIT